MAKHTLLTLMLAFCCVSMSAQKLPEEKISMTFYALRNMYVDSVYVSPLVEQQMKILMQCLDPHSEYLTPEQARANEEVLLSPTAQGHTGAALTTTLDARMLDKTIGYISVGIFMQDTPDLFANAIDSLRRQGMKRLILDIRNNPGGFFDAALAMADEFLAEGSLMVTTEGKHQPRQEVKALRKGLFEQGQLVVLINAQTMSAAEIFAGALQDWDRAVLVGSRTFGKGLIQETLPFSDGSAIRLSVARYCTPSGRSIQKPYANRPRESYWNEVDSRPANGALPAESKLKPYETLRTHRTIYGGGGIAPDVFVPADSDPVQKALDILRNDRLYKQLLTTSTTATWTSFTPAATKRAEITGRMPDRSYDGRTIILEHRHPINFNLVTTIDSTVISNGHFTLNTAIADTLSGSLCQLRLADVQGTDAPSIIDLRVILTEGQTQVTIDSIGQQLNGTAANEAFSRQVLQAERQRRQALFALNGHYNQLQRTRSLTAAEEAERQHSQDSISQAFMTVYSRFIREHIDQPYANELLFCYPLNRYTAADSTFLTTHCNQQLLAQHQEREADRQRRIQRFQESVKATGIGAHYREITAQTPDGQPVKLSELIQPGHVTLLDFWASWCVPCQQEIPFLKELYKKYHDKGFDIISISLDKSKSAWLKAVDKQQMPWPQMADLKAWDGPITQDYGIQAIPFVLLLDSQGNIALKNLHDHLLEAAIKKQLNL